jgi:uncharacterized membrane protein YoaK (UPF0700 family)
MPRKLLSQILARLTSVKVLTGMLSLIAGSVDVISFLGLHGLFVSHITGNLVILAVYMVNVGTAPLALILAVPVFVLALGLTKIWVYFLNKSARDSLRPLLRLQFLLLLGFLIFALTRWPILGGMLGVSAMAVQNALVQLSLKNSPSTAVMTTNVTRFVLDVGEIILGKDADTNRAASARAQGTWPAIVGFTIGCAVGALCEMTWGLWALLLPVMLALFIVVIERYGVNP